jgi:hypothetical protein
LFRFFSYGESPGGIIRIAHYPGEVLKKGKAFHLPPATGLSFSGLPSVIMKGVLFKEKTFNLPTATGLSFS